VIKMKKVNLGKKLFHMANALAHGVRPKRFRCKFMAPGLTNYPGEDGNGEEMWYLPRDVMNAMQESFIGCPVVAEKKHDGSSTPEKFKDVAVGVVSDISTDKDGWDNADFIVWDEETLDLIEKGYNVSCAYNTIEYDPGGTLNAIDYDHEVKDAEYLHLAIVESPRQTGSRILTNALDSEDEGAIIFENSWGGKMSKFKLFPNGRVKLNSAENLGHWTKLKDREEIFSREVIETAEKYKGNPIPKSPYKIDNKGEVYKGNSKENVAPPGWEKTVEEMKGKPEIEEPFALAWWMKEKGYKPNEADIDKSWGEFKTSKKNEDEEVSELKKNITDAQKKIDELTKKNKEDEDMKKNGIDLKNAVIETPGGDVKLQDMLIAYEATKKIEGKLNMDSEYNGVKISAMYEAYKKNQEETEEEKKKKEEAAKKSEGETEEEKKKKEEEGKASKKNEDRKEALKSEGKTDEEIEGIMKSEVEAEEKERKEKEDELALKSAEEESEKAKTEATNKMNHFNSLADARNKKVEVKDSVLLTKSQRIKAARSEY